MTRDTIRNAAEHGPPRGARATRRHHHQVVVTCFVDDLFRGVTVLDFV